MATRKLKWTEFVPIFGKKEPMDRFIVCLNKSLLGKWKDEQYTELVSACKTSLGVDLAWDLTYGGTTFELYWKDRDKAYPVMHFLLRRNIPIFTQTHMCVNIGPGQLGPGEVLTPEWLDRSHALVTREQVKEGAKYYDGDVRRSVYSHCDYYKNIYTHEASWITEEGRALVRWVQSMYYMDEADLSSDEEVRVEQPVPMDITIPDPVPNTYTIGDILSGIAKHVEAEPEQELCMICLDRQPNTLVLPCMDCVVCSVCSVGLKKTPDKFTCVKCRRPITSVEVDGGQS